MSVQTLLKRSGSMNTSSKFIIDCSSRLTANMPTTEAWLQILEKLSRVLLGVLEKTEKIVIKIGNVKHLEKEYNIGNRLANLDGFVRYICFSHVMISSATTEILHHYVKV